MFSVYMTENKQRQEKKIVQTLNLNRQTKQKAIITDWYRFVFHFDCSFLSKINI